MIATSTVRRMRKSGIGKQKRLRTASILLTKDWLGKKVVVLDDAEYRIIKREISTLRRNAGKILRLCQL